MTPLRMVAELARGNADARRVLTGAGEPGLATLLAGTIAAGDDPTAGGGRGAVSGSSRRAYGLVDVYAGGSAAASPSSAPTRSGGSLAAIVRDIRRSGQ